MWAGVFLAGWAYQRSFARVRGFPRVRRFHFFAGLTTLLIALASPIAVYEGSLFWMHMVQHLLLVLVAPPLLLLGTPVTLALRASSPSTRKRLLRVLHSPALKVLTHPVVTWSLFAFVMWMTHFSGLYDLALENALVHIGEHAVYLAAALLFWWPVVGLEPTAGRLRWPARLAYVVLAMPQQAFLGLAVYSSTTPLYAHYVTLGRGWGPAVLADQRLAGMVMWIVGDFLFLLALVIGIFAWMRADAREAAHVDRRLDSDLRA
jgi:putative membrane protein